MLACVDVDYRDPIAIAACVLFSDWVAPRPQEELTEIILSVQPYQPGSFYKRELPCLLAVLARVRVPLDAIIVDAYVDVAPGRAGLGRHLFDALGVPVVGVAKTSFAGATQALPVLRGASRQPLYVTAVGFDPRLAADSVRRMSGEHRVPALLKRVDWLCRDAPGM